MKTCCNGSRIVREDDPGLHLALSDPYHFSELIWRQFGLIDLIIFAEYFRHPALICFREFWQPLAGDVALSLLPAGELAVRSVDPFRHFLEG